ncbi:MAG: archease [Nanoarchaeota archaeon]|nr:archease [Nanoarchaeota archaeon]MBU2519968.1 archease [Nanoarchaeota archaeon]
MEKYKFIEDLTSDVMFEAYGRDLKEVFTNAAEAMFTIICQAEKIKHEKSVKINAKAGSAKELMIAWLQELIAAVDTEEMFFSKFEILEIDENHIKAKIYGESITPEKGGTVVKAVTYYKYKFEKMKKGYVARVSLDI